MIFVDKFQTYWYIETRPTSDEFLFKGEFHGRF